MVSSCNDDVFSYYVFDGDTLAFILQKIYAQILPRPLQQVVGVTGSQCVLVVVYTNLVFRCPLATCCQITQDAFKTDYKQGLKVLTRICHVVYCIDLSIAGLWCKFNDTNINGY